MRTVSQRTHRLNLAQTTTTPGRRMAVSLAADTPSTQDHGRADTLLERQQPPPPPPSASFLSQHWRALLGVGAAAGLIFGLVKGEQGDSLVLVMLCAAGLLVLTLATWRMVQPRQLLRIQRRS